jgi:CheY-like chemotaxis protein
MSPLPERPQTILCVDDLADNLLIRKLMLETFGYCVLTAGSPKEAISVLEAEDVDLVLLDYSFPKSEENGEWLARKVRERWAGTKTLMLSGYAEIPKSVRETVDRFCTKGSDTADFRQAVFDLLPRAERPKPLTEVQVRNRKLREEAQRLMEEVRRRRRA